MELRGLAASSQHYDSAAKLEAMVQSMLFDYCTWPRQIVFARLLQTLDNTHPERTTALTRMILESKIYISSDLLVAYEKIGRWDLLLEIIRNRCLPNLNEPEATISPDPACIHDLAVIGFPDKPASFSRSESRVVSDDEDVHGIDKSLILTRNRILISLLYVYPSNPKGVVEVLAQLFPTSASFQDIADKRIRALLRMIDPQHPPLPSRTPRIDMIQHLVQILHPSSSSSSSSL